MIGPAIASKLTSVSAITNLIGTRIYPSYVLLADKTYPLCTYEVENVIADMTSTGPTGLETADVKIACIDTTYLGAATLAKQVQLALNGQTGTWGGVPVQGAFLKDGEITDDVITDPGDTEAILYFVKDMQFHCAYDNS